MIWGFGAALTWALDTVILSVALAKGVFVSTPQAIALAAFVSTFLHDAGSAVTAFVYMALRRKLKDTLAILKTRAGLVIMGAALIGGPLGMTGYVISVNNIGASYAAAISAFFPAWGAFLAAIALKERMHWFQWLGLIACLAAVAVLGYTPAEGIPGNWTVGIIGALACVLGWGTEAVVVDWGLRNTAVDNEVAMQIRQTTSALAYAVIILPVLGGWGFVTDVLGSDAMPFVALAGASGTVSYLCYYRAIDLIGASRAMAVNITYSAWAIPISLIILGSIPDVKGVVCAIVIILGAICAATDVRSMLGATSQEA